MSSIDRPVTLSTDTLPAARRSLTDSIAAIGFWASIALPAVYLPLLLSGLDTGQELLLFLGLFGIHIAALVAGQGHERPG